MDDVANPRYFLDALPVGTRVRVSNGLPRPPDRFNKKLGNWLSDNFTGRVEQVEEPDGDWRPFGAVVLSNDRYPPGYSGAISFLFNYTLGPNTASITPIEPEDLIANLRECRRAGVTEEQFDSRNPPVTPPPADVELSALASDYT